MAARAPKAPTVDRQAEFSVEDDMLVIRMPLASPPVPSASGKTLVVASTRGNVVTPVQINGQPVIVGLNAYIRKT